MAHLLGGGGGGDAFHGALGQSSTDAAADLIGEGTPSLGLLALDECRIAIALFVDLEFCDSCEDQMQSDCICANGATEGRGRGCELRGLRGLRRRRRGARSYELREVDVHL